VSSKPICAAILLLLASSPSQSAVQVNINQVGADVVAVASGTLNVGSLGAPGAASTLGLMQYVALGNYAYTVGQGSANAYAVTFVTQQPLHAVAIDVPASVSTGGPVGVDAGAGAFELFVPAGYVSGAAINSSSTWTNRTFASLGLSPGAYVFNYGADNITFLVGPQGSATVAVPSSTPLAQLLIALGVALLAWRSRRKATSVEAG